MKKWFLCIALLMSLFLTGCIEGAALPKADGQNPSEIQLQNKTDQEENRETEVVRMNVTIGEKIFVADLSNNSSADALVTLLKNGPLTIELHDYGNFEKVGAIGQSLPRNDERITTGPGDIILYQGNQLTIYYATNTWEFTSIGHIPNVTTEELLAVLGEGNVTVQFSLSEE